MRHKWFLRLLTLSALVGLLGCVAEQTGDIYEPEQPATYGRGIVPASGASDYDLIMSFPERSLKPYRHNNKVDEFYPLYYYL